RACGGGRDFAQQFPGMGESRTSPLRTVSQHPGCPPTRTEAWRRSRELRLATFRPPLAGFTNQKKERRLQNGFQPFVRLHGNEGYVYSTANEFLREVEALKREQLSRREPRELARPRDNDAPVRPITSFHTDSRYGCTASRIFAGLLPQPRMLLSHS